MAETLRVRVHLDARGGPHVDVEVDGEPDILDTVASKRSEPVTHFGDEEFKARQHIRHSGF